MPRINTAELRAAMSSGALLRAKIDEILSQCEPDNPPYLSDLLIDYNGGGVLMMEALGQKFDADRISGVPREMCFRWRLHAMKDEWGNVPQPGDTIIRRIQKPLNHTPDKLVTSRELQQDKLAGTYDDKWIIKVPYIVDAKGCIECEFQDAVYFLRTFGVHGKSGQPMAMHARESTEAYERYERNAKDSHRYTKTWYKPELSGNRQEAPDGNKYHIWYWRYKEVDMEDYESMKPIQSQDVVKRGRPPKR